MHEAIKNYDEGDQFSKFVDFFQTNVRDCACLYVDNDYCMLSCSSDAAGMIMQVIGYHTTTEQKVCQVAVNVPVTTFKSVGLKRLLTQLKTQLKSGLRQDNNDTANN